MTLEERLERLEKEVTWLQSRISELNSRTVGQMIIESGCIPQTFDTPSNPYTILTTDANST